MNASRRVTLFVAMGLSFGACKQQGTTKAITKNFAEADAASEGAAAVGAASEAPDSQVAGVGGCFGTRIRCVPDEFGFKNEVILNDDCDPRIPEKICVYADDTQSRSWCGSADQIGAETLMGANWDSTRRCSPGTPPSN